jgi:ubiquinone/menaquinone biosynthesis C-methylase UbiE
MHFCLLNLGCGTKISARAINIDSSLALRISQNRVLRFGAALLMDEARKGRILGVSTPVILHNLAKGIPFPDNSVDAVYHSHMLEHFDRGDVYPFFSEVLRVLKPGGYHRICVPDLELAARNYLSSLQNTVLTGDGANHDEFVAQLLEQSVRKEAHGTSQQHPLRRMLENIFLGDARKRRETHQWMYDRVNLPAKLKMAGFTEIKVRAWNDSSIPEWPAYGLEIDVSSKEYLAGSLYVECSKPE